MSARRLDSLWVCEQVKADYRPRIERLTALGRKPAIAAVIAGKPGTHISVFNDLHYCRQMGLRARECTFPADVTQAQLADEAHKLNGNSEFDSILFAVPPGRDAASLRLAVAPCKDAVGLHPANLGMLAANQPAPRHCAAAGILELLKRYDIPLAGKRVVLVGDREGAAAPLALLLLHENATITICLAEDHDQIRQADVLITNLGRPASIGKESLNPGSVIVDAGGAYVSRLAEIERIFGQMPEKLADFQRWGNIMAGDVHPYDANLAASAYIQVPAGSVRPLSRIMLVSNVVGAAEAHAS